MPVPPVQTLCWYTSDKKLSATARREWGQAAAGWIRLGSRSLLLINKVSIHHTGLSPAFTSLLQGHLALPILRLEIPCYLSGFFFTFPTVNLKFKSLHFPGSATPHPSFHLPNVVALVSLPGLFFLVEWQL